MVVFLSGKNSYSRSNKLREVVSVYSEKTGGLKPKEFDFSEGAEDSLTKDLEHYVNSGNLFGEKKLILITNPFETGDKKILKKVFQDSLEDKSQILIVVSEKDEPKSFNFLAEKPAVHQRFPEIKKGKELNSFILKEALDRGMKLSKDDVYHLSEMFGADLWGITSELDKLVLSEGKIEGVASHDFFKTLSTLKYSKDLEEKLCALEVLLTIRKDDSAKIFNILSSGLRDNKKLEALADYDVLIKTGKLNYEESLLDFALNY